MYDRLLFPWLIVAVLLLGALPLIAYLFVIAKRLWRYFRCREDRRHWRCVECGYDLRGTIERRRCPECGVSFNRRLYPLKLEAEEPKDEADQRSDDSAVS